VLPFRLSPSYVTWGPPPVSARRGLPRLVLVHLSTPRARFIYLPATRSGAGAGGLPLPGLRITAAGGTGRLPARPVSMAGSSWRTWALLGPFQGDPFASVV